MTRLITPWLPICAPKIGFPYSNFNVFQISSNSFTQTSAICSQLLGVVDNFGTFEWPKESDLEQFLVGSRHDSGYRTVSGVVETSQLLSGQNPQC